MFSRAGERYGVKGNQKGEGGEQRHRVGKQHGSFRDLKYGQSMGRAGDGK